MEPVYLTPEFPNSQLRLEKSLSSERAESKDCFWPNQVYLPEKIRAARGNLVRHRVAIARRAVLEDVADEDVLPPQVNRLEDLGEELASGPDEWAAARVLVRPRGFPNDDEVGIEVDRTLDELGRCRDSGDNTFNLERTLDLDVEP